MWSNAAIHAKLFAFAIKPLPANIQAMKERIGILTGGGDCPGLNAVIRAVVKSATKRGWETLGFINGFEGLLEPISYRRLDYKEMEPLLFVGGTVLGTTNRGRFAAKTGHGDLSAVPRETLEQAKNTVQKLGLRALVVVGGDGSLSIAQQLFECGVPVVGVPKTIDNDLEATAFTFGFDSAVACATDALDRLRTTAQSHERVMVLELMGRYAGWIAVHAGISGGGDVILIPEIPFCYESICATIAEREREDKHFTLIVVAEGARERGKDYVTAAVAEKNREAHLGGIGAVVAAEVQQRTGKETRVCVLGHLQRGGSPTAHDRIFATRVGAAAYDAVIAGKFGMIPVVRDDNVVLVPLATVAEGKRKVPREIYDLCSIFF